MGSHTIPYALEAHEDTHVSGGSDDIDSALALAAMADLATGKVWIGNVTNRPFPIDFPAVGKVAFGTYPGNGSQYRQITTGFVCKFVVIQERDTISVYTYLVLNTLGSDCLELRDTDDVDDRTTPYLHAITGFVVGEEPNGDYSNSNGKTYVYAAFG